MCSSISHYYFFSSEEILIHTYRQGGKRQKRQRCMTQNRNCNFFIFLHKEKHKQMVAKCSLEGKLP